MDKRRVVITGLGVFCALGKDRTEFWEAVTAGRSAIGPIEGIDLGRMAIRNGAQIRDYDPETFIEDREDRTVLDPFAQYGLLSSREAVRHAGLEFDEALGARTAVITGSSVGGATCEDEGFRTVYQLGKKRVHPFSIPRMMANAAASRISMEWGLRGPVYNLSTACASANHALGLAYWTVRDGVADVALAGGSEALFTYANLLAWDALRVVSPTTCRPFCKDRQGMVLGDGAATLVLETLDRARKRGAPILAEVSGFGMSADAHHLTMASLEGPAAAMQAALDDAGLAPEDVTYVNAHGTGTIVNDPNEVKAIRHVFGAQADRLAVSSTKSMHGHALGASGALEAAATVLGLASNTLPPTANFTEADPECDLDFVPNEARSQEMNAALSNSLAFGGLNAVIAMRRFTG